MSDTAGDLLSSFCCVKHVNMLTKKVNTLLTVNRRSLEFRRVEQVLEYSGGSHPGWGHDRRQGGNDRLCQQGTRVYDWFWGGRDDRKALLCPEL